MTNKEMKIYHVETQEDYDDLMIKLEAQGYKWMSGDKPTIKSQYWDKQRENTAIVLDGLDEHHIARGSISWCKGLYSNAPVIKHKAKGAKQMEKVVVPQFVADWFEKNKNGVTIYGLLHLFSDNYFLYDGFRKWVKDYDINEGEAQDILAKMYLFQDYEIEVEEEKKYYWHKKKEHILEFETVEFTYLNYRHIPERLFFSGLTQNENHKTKFTETEIKKLVSKEDFNKLEKVEIEDV